MAFKNLIEELTWRGLLHDTIPGTEEQLLKEMTIGYVGFDPTADSLHIGNMVPVMLLKHLQMCGHKPIALVGGATGMVGDPSGKSQERNMLDNDILQHNLACQKKQLEKFLDFDCGSNSAEVVNNYDWFKDMTFLDFIRDVGKHISVNYMMAKDSVKNRLETGMSFTEFSYQLVQGYDFVHLNAQMNCKLQMGGSDQWGNITTGTELIRRKGGSDAFALTAPLLKKADGTKFGKSEGGNVWIDKKKTSVYDFHQYWLNAADADAGNLIRVFTLKSKEEIEALEAEHAKDPGARILQRALADDVTERVHSKEDLNIALKAREILFGKNTSEELANLNESEILGIFDGVGTKTLPKSMLVDGLGIIDALAGESNFLASNGEARRQLKQNAVSVNKKKVNDQKMISSDDLINEKYVVLQKGKKDFFLLQFD